MRVGSLVPGPPCGPAAPANDTITDTAAFVFTLLPANQPNAGTRSIRGIEIGDGSTAVPAFTIAGTLLTIGAAGIVKQAASLQTTLSSDVALAAAQAWINDSATLLNVTGNVTLGGNVLTTAGSGSTTLAGMNTFTGTTFVQGGTLLLTSGSAISDTGALVLANSPGVRLELTNQNETIGSIAGGVTAGGDITLGDFQSVAALAGISPYQGLSFSSAGNGTWWSGTTARGQMLRFTEFDGSLVIVPEPSTLVLAVIGGGLLVALWRARRRACRRPVPVIASLLFQQAVDPQPASRPACAAAGPRARP